MPSSFVEQRQGEVRKQSKMAFNLANIFWYKRGDVLTSSFLPSTGGQGPELRCFRSILRQRGGGRVNSIFLGNEKDTALEPLLPIGFV